MTAQESILLMKLTLMARACSSAVQDAFYHGAPVDLEEIESHMAVLQAEIKGYREEQHAQSK